MGLKMSENMEKLKNALTLAVTQTMENMTFEEVSTVTDDKVTVVIPAQAVWAKLPMIAPYEGSLLLNASTECSESLVHEVYGFCDEEGLASSMRDVLSEVANTIAGRFFGEFIPADEEFSLGLPDSGKGAMPVIENEVMTINLKIGEHFLKVSLYGSDFLTFTENQNKE